MNFIIIREKLLGSVHTYPDIFEDGDFVLRLSLPSTSKRRFRAPKTEVSKAPSREDFFENAGLSFSCGRTLFEYDDVSPVYPGPLRVDVYFFKTDKKNLRFQKYPDAC